MLLHCRTITSGGKGAEKGWEKGMGGEGQEPKEGRSFPSGITIKARLAVVGVDNKPFKSREDQLPQATDQLMNDQIKLSHVLLKIYNQSTKLAHWWFLQTTLGTYDTEW